MIHSEDGEVAAQWNETSSKEFQIAGPVVYRQMIDSSYMVKSFFKDGSPFMMAGLIRPSLTEVPYLWTLLTSVWQDLTPSEVRLVVKMANAWAPRCQTFVEQGNVKAERLARVFGFKSVGSTMVVGTSVYVLYRRGG